MKYKYSNIFKILSKTLDKKTSEQIINNLEQIAKDCEILEVYFKKYLEIIEDQDLNKENK